MTIKKMHRYAKLNEMYVEMWDNTEFKIFLENISNERMIATVEMDDEMCGRFALEPKYPLMIIIMIMITINNNNKSNDTINNELN